MAKRAKYFVTGRGTTADDAYECDVNFDYSDATDAKWIAEECAQDYHDNRDGWESKWPIKLSLILSDGIHDFEIERESVPQFHARLSSKSAEKQ